MARFTATQIRSIGGNSWTPSNGGAERIYLNDWATLAGLEIDTYKTGNISYAELGGRKISNSKAYKLLSGSKVYFNTADGQLYFQGGARELMDEVIDGITNALAAIEDAAYAENIERAAATPAAGAAQQILTALRAAGRTITQIAAALGVHRSTLYRWIAGTRRPRPANLTNLTALAA